MGKRHNRKRTRSRPRHRDGNPQNQNHTRSISIDTTSSQATNYSSFEPRAPSFLPIANNHGDHWQETYSAWQHRLRVEHVRQQELETQRLRYFGGEYGEEVSLLEPMLQVVMDLFDGNTDYEDP
jgi:hypothetical protein